MRPWRLRCTPFSCPRRLRPARSRPRSSSRSQKWAATSPRSCHRLWRPASKRNSSADFFHRCRNTIPAFQGADMIRFLSLVAALFVIAPALAQQLPANLDKDNALVIDTTKGRVIIKLRPDLAPKHVERMKQLARDG